MGEHQITIQPQQQGQIVWSSCDLFFSLLVMQSNNKQATKFLNLLSSIMVTQPETLTKAWFNRPNSKAFSCSIRGQYVQYM